MDWNIFKSSKKSLKVKSDKDSDFDFDKYTNDDFDFGSFADFDGTKPTTKPIKSALLGFKESAYSNVTSSTELLRNLRKLLPDNYGDIFDTTDALKQSYTDSLRKSAEQLKPLKTQLNTISGRLASKGENILPEKILSRLKKMSNEDANSSSSYVKEKEDIQETLIRTTLGNIFSAKEEADQARYRFTQNKENQKEFLAQNRHKQTLGQLDAIRQAVQSNQQYQDKILINFQRKSLELQIRQYAITADTLAFMKGQHIDLKNELAAIKVNTGLSDFSKMTGSETFKQILRNKFITNTQSALFQTGKNFLPNLFKNIGKNATNAVGNFSQSAIFALSGLETSLDMMDAFGDQIDPYRMAGGAVGDWIKNTILDKGKKKIGKNKKLNKFGSSANIWMANAEANLRKQLDKEWENRFSFDLDEDQDFDFDNKEKSLKDKSKAFAKKINPLKKNSKIRNFLFSVLEEGFYDTVNSKLNFDRDNLNSSTKATVITGKVTKSITEIMPGYLARILREITALRTGDNNVELVEYDYIKDKFSTRDSIKRSIIASITNNGNYGENYAARMNFDVYNKDIDNNQILTPSIKSKLNKILINAARDGNTIIDKKWLINPNSFSAIGSPLMAEKIAYMFKNYLDDDPDRKKEEQLVKSIKGSLSLLGNPLAFLQDVINVGQADILEEMGLLSQNRGSSTLDENKYIDILFDKHNKTEFNKTTTYSNSVKGFRRNTFSQTNIDEDKVSTLEKNANLNNKLEELIERNISSNEKIIESILASSTRDINDNILNSVLSIYDRLGESQAIAVSQMTGTPVTEKEIFLAKDLPWFKKNRSFGDQLRVFQKKISYNFLNLLKKTAKWSVVGPAKAMWWTTKSTLTAPFKVIKGITETKNRVDNLIGDVYVKGEMSPRITKIQLVRGLYIDKNTGKKIKNFKDISGDVIDKEGNVILSSDEVKYAYVSLGLTKKTINLTTIIGSKALELGLGVLRGSMDIYTASMKAAWGLSKYTFKATKKLLFMDLPQDVYVAGLRGPALTAKLMRLGEYFDVNSGRYIRCVKDITGPVINSDGDVVLTEEQFEAGLMNKFGQKLGGDIKRTVNFINRRIANVANFGLGIARFTGKTMLGAAKLSLNTLKWGAGAFKSLISGKGIRILSFDHPEQAQAFTASAAGTIVEKLDSIYNLLDDRIADQTVEGDYDGSGYRDGSVAEQMAKRRAAKLAKATGFKISPDDTPLEQLVKLFKKFTKRQEEQMEELIDETDENGDISALGSAMDMFGRRKSKGVGKAAGKVKGGKLRGLRGKLGKFGGKGLAGLIAGGLAYSAYNDAKKGDYVSAGLEGTGAAASGASMLGGVRGLGGVSKVAGRFALPLTIALGGYSAYQNYKKGDYKSTTGDIFGTGGALAGAAGGAALGATIGTFIFPGVGTAVGFFLGGLAGGIAGSSFGSWVGKKAYSGWQWLTGSDNDEWHKVRLAQYGFLDKSKGAPVFKLEELCEQAMIKSGNVPEIISNKLNQKEILSIFDIDQNDQASVSKFRDWFLNRFKPIWQANEGLLLRLQPDAKLSNLDNLSKEVKSKFIDAMVKLGSDAYRCMISPFKNEKQLDADADHVKAMLIELQKKYGTSDAKKQKEISDTQKSLLASSTVGASLANNGEKPNLQNQLNNSNKNIGFNKETVLKVGLLGSPLGIQAAALSFFVPSAQASSMIGNEVDALTAIRVKAYGLSSLEPGKVRNLLSLEQSAMNYISIAVNKISINGNINQLANNISVTFGGDLKESYTWLINRFLPVFTAYISALKSQGINSNYLAQSNQLPASKKIAIADAIKSVNSPSGVSIWSITASPWQNYVLSNNSSIVNANYLSLTTKAKSESMSEQKVSDAKVKTAEKTGIFGNVLDSLKSFASGIRTNISNTYGQAKESVTNAIDTVSNEVGTTVTNIKDNISDIANNISGAFNSISGSNKEKFQRIYNAAKQAGEPHPAVLAAQWALESCWGKKCSGKNNYFGIKATANEPGTMASTKEEINGRLIRTRARFKDYNSIEEGIKDRVSLTKRKDSYISHGYFRAKTPLEAAKALSRAGYATDSGYVSKLASIMKSAGIDPSKPDIGFTTAQSSNNGSKGGGFPTWGRGTGAKNENTVIASTSNREKKDLQKQISKNTVFTPSASSLTNPVYSNRLISPAKKQISLSIDGGYAGSINSVAKNTVPDRTSKSVIAAKNATSKASGKSKGLCARYVADALQGAGYKFTRNGSAYQYATNGTLKKIGFNQIPNEAPGQIGDIKVFSPIPGHPHGHIQIYNGKKWISDFLQAKDYPYGSETPHTTWRDGNYNGETMSKSEPSIGRDNWNNASSTSPISNNPSLSSRRMGSYGGFTVAGAGGKNGIISYGDNNIPSDDGIDNSASSESRTNNSSPIDAVFDSVQELLPNSSSTISKLRTAWNLGKNIYNVAKQAGSNASIIKNSTYSGIDLYGSDISSNSNLHEFNSKGNLWEPLDAQQRKVMNDVNVNKTERINNTNAELSKATSILSEQLKVQQRICSGIEMIISYLKDKNLVTSTSKNDVQKTVKSEVTDSNLKPLSPPLLDMSA